MCDWGGGVYGNGAYDPHGIEKHNRAAMIDVVPPAWHQKAYDVLAVATEQGWRIKSWRLSKEHVDELAAYTGRRDLLLGIPIIEV
jgi:hypothetical protein